MQLIENDEHREIFKNAHTLSSASGWLQLNKLDENYSNYYEHFHKNLGKICSVSLHDQGRDYYIAKNYNNTEARAKVEDVAKGILPILIRNNFKKYVQLVYASVIHGLKSHILFWSLVLLLLFSGIKSLTTQNNNYLIVLFLTSLILSNAFIVSFSSYSIVRLVFYHYVSIALLFIWITKLVIQKFESDS